MEPEDRRIDGTPWKMDKWFLKTNECPDNWLMMPCSSRAVFFRALEFIQTIRFKNSEFQILVFRFRLEHGVDDEGKAKDLTPNLANLEGLQAGRWKDDYSANKALRNIFRVS